MNANGIYAVIDKDDKIIEKFRTKSTALSMMSKFKLTTHDKLKIIKLK